MILHTSSTAAAKTLSCFRLTCGKINQTSLLLSYFFTWCLEVVDEVVYTCEIVEIVLIELKSCKIMEGR